MMDSAGFSLGQIAHQRRMILVNVAVKGSAFFPMKNEIAEGAAGLYQVGR
jgi:hypothetical protein